MVVCGFETVFGAEGLEEVGLVDPGGSVCDSWIWEMTTYESMID